MKKYALVICLLYVPLFSSEYKHPKKSIATETTPTLPKKDSANNKTKKPKITVEKNENKKNIEKQESEKKPHSLTIKNNITKKMLTYDKHWAKPVPSKFVLTVNDKELKNDMKKSFSISQETINVKYECEFKKFGILYHREVKEITLAVPPDQKELDVKFSWDADSRINIAQAKEISCITLEGSKENHVA